MLPRSRTATRCMPCRRAPRNWRGASTAFMEEHVYPAEPVFARQLETAADRWHELPVMAELKAKAKAAGLWNLFLPKRHFPDALTNLEYAPLCEIMGRSPIGSEPFNCSAPDTGNMETLILYGTEEQKKRWLTPLMDGEIRSCFAMTEPAVASSDATNIRAEIRRDGDHYVINGRKWWTSGAMDTRCKIAIFMGKTDPAGRAAPAPVDGAGADGHAGREGDARAAACSATTTRRTATPRSCSRTCGCRRRTSCSAKAAASRSRRGGSGPAASITACGSIGVAERALETHVPARDRRAPPSARAIADQGVTRHWIAESRMEIDQARLLTLHAAHMMDTVGNKAARAEIAMIKVVAPNMAQKVIDRAIQVCGGGRRQPGLPPRLCVCAHPRAAPRRRPGRGPSRDRRQAGAAQISLQRQSEAP